MSRRLLSLIAVAVATAGLAACEENLESGGGCPLLCPRPAIELRDTLIDAVVVDSTLVGFPAIGFEEALLLANRGDSLETRVVIRFDSLPRQFTRPNIPTPEDIAFVDSVTLRLRVNHPLRDSAAFTLRAFDVDTILPEGSVADTSVATLAPLFREERLLGTMTVTPGALADSTIHLRLSSAKLLEKIVSQSRLRIGLTMESAVPASVRLAGVGDATLLSLRFRVDPDTSIAPIVIQPVSRTPAAEPFTATALRDYQVVWRGTPPPPVGLIAVGGVPARRTYLRFELPSRIVDSTRVVRAALLLVQAPNRASPLRSDTMTVFPDVIVADTNITNLDRAVRFTSRTFAIGATGQASVPQLRLVPSDSGTRTVEIAPLIAAWSAIGRGGVPRALVLRADEEGQVSGSIFFFSNEAPAGVRPRLRLTYAPRLEFGLP